VTSTLQHRLRGSWLRLLARKKLKQWPRPWRLCLGSGAAPIQGWINVDLDARADLRLDLRCPLPFPDGSVAWIHSEHLLEHLRLEAGVALLRECRRVLTSEGVLRIAMPDLETLIDRYVGADWKDQDWLRWPAHAFIDTPARMLNVAFRAFGHEYLYDADELLLRLRQAGFVQTQRCGRGESRHAELRGLETRADSLLVVEAWGRAA
jgi:predicted SAM-dependent methyltransferase